MQPHSFSKRKLAATALMLDEEENNAALSDKKKHMWVHKCFRSRKSEGSHGSNSDGGIFAHSKLQKYLETHLGIPEDTQLLRTSFLAPHVIVVDEAFPLKTYLPGGASKSLAPPTSHCHRMESIVSLERGVCSCAELQVFSCYRG